MVRVSVKRAVEGLDAVPVVGFSGSDRIWWINDVRRSFEFPKILLKSIGVSDISFFGGFR